MANEKAPKNTYFLGTSTPKCFVTPINEIIQDTENTVYILKGTAGSGKSTLMKKISQAFPHKPQEIFRCSADPYSMDAVYFTDIKLMIIDGTAPHCIDPVYPKAVESIIDLGAYIDSAPLKAAKNEIIGITKEYSEFHKRCRLCLSAISSVAEDIRSAAGGLVIKDKLDGFTSRTAKRLLPKKADTHGRSGKLISRQLSAMTMNGYYTYIPENCDIYLLSDDRIAASEAFLREFTDTALKKGYDVIVSRCLICSEPFIEHIVIPELNLALITSDCINSIKLTAPKKIISFRRFYEKTALKYDTALKQRLSFGKKAVVELIGEAASAMRSAKAKHDLIEKYYISAADFDGLNRLSYKLISEIKGMEG
ncbi:MAG: ATPase [Huintestinicola sp.]